VRAEERLPPDPAVQRHARGDAPRVLAYRAEVTLWSCRGPPGRACSRRANRPVRKSVMSRAR
jgi:hypothetical protein